MRRLGCRRPAGTGGLAPALDKLGDLGPLPEDITVCLDAGYDSQKTRDELVGRGMTGKSPIRATRSPSRRDSAATSSGPTPGPTPLNRLQRCHERNEDVIDAFVDLADAIITVRGLIREAWTLYR